jgi:tartrate dehydratase alpha subunit/fumarate hydratase class I-like protein
VPTYSFQVSQGNLSKTAIETVFENNEAARQGAMAFCADLGRDIFSGLRPGADWQMKVANEAGDAIFQIRLYAWTFE